MMFLGIGILLISWCVVKYFQQKKERDYMCIYHFTQLDRPGLVSWIDNDKCWVCELYGEAKDAFRKA